MKAFIQRTNINAKSSFSLYFSTTKFFATKMRGTVTKNNKDSAGRRLGLKVGNGEGVFKGDILIRQRGFKYKPGENVHVGKDQTLHASKEGNIKFTTDPWKNFKQTRIHVVEKEVPNKHIRPPYPFMYHPELYPDLAINNNKENPFSECLIKLKDLIVDKQKSENLQNVKNKTKGLFKLSNNKCLKTLKRKILCKVNSNKVQDSNDITKYIKDNDIISFQNRLFPSILSNDFDVEEILSEIPEDDDIYNLNALKNIELNEEDEENTEVIAKFNPILSSNIYLNFLLLNKNKKINKSIESIKNKIKFNTENNFTNEDAEKYFLSNKDAIKHICFIAFEGKFNKAIKLSKGKNLRILDEIVIKIEATLKNLIDGTINSKTFQDNIKLYTSEDSEYYASLYLIIKYSGDFNIERILQEEYTKVNSFLSMINSCKSNQENFKENKLTTEEGCLNEYKQICDDKK